MNKILRIALAIFLLCMFSKVYAFDDIKLYDLMVRDAKDSNVDLTKPSIETGDKGVYIFKDKDNKEYYYYRGDALNNVEWDGNCYSMVRTVNDKGVKLLYRGKLKDDGSCPVGGKDIWINTTEVQYASSNDENKIPYKNSLLKQATEKWFEENLIDKKYAILDTVYCNDLTKSELGDNHFTTYERLINPTLTTLVCNKKDSYTVSSKLGNGLLKYPVGHITSDELILAGASYTNNTATDSYLLTYKYWSMSPNNGGKSNSKMLYPNSLGVINRNNLTYKTGIRPVIAVKYNMYTNSGDGTVLNPYHIFYKESYNVEVIENELGKVEYENKDYSKDDIVKFKILTSENISVKSIEFYNSTGEKIDIKYSIEKGIYSFKMIDEDVTIKVNYEKIDVVNPNTSDSIIAYTIILIVSVISISFIFNVLKQKVR